MKKNKMMRIASVLLVAVLLSTCAISGTFAKYVSTGTATASATVAKWDIKVNNGQLAAPNPDISFNLFDTRYDSDGKNIDADVTDEVLAPGTTGSFKFVIVNASNVSADYTISFEEKVDNIENVKAGEDPVTRVPIEYSLDGQTWKESIKDLKISSTEDKYLSISTTDNSKTETVYWRWQYERSDDADEKAAADAIDTALGIAAQGENPPTVTITATITVTQKD